MAILNYASSLSDVQSYLTNSADHYKLVFTGDGHIITHGVDYTKDYINGARGLVPNYDTTITNGVLSKDGWTNILSVLPIANNITDGDTEHIPTNAQLVNYIKNQIKVAETLRFNGGIGFEDSKYYHTPTNGNKTEGFPKNCKIGDSYRILTSGVIVAGAEQQVGDMIVCIKDTTEAAETSSEYWLVIQANIQGTSTISINGTGYNVYTGSIYENIPAIYAPSTPGSSGNILLSSGTTPLWGNLNITDTGYLQITTGSTTAINKPIVANKVALNLTLGTGLNFGNVTDAFYNGSATRTIYLNTASTTVLGGVKIDNTTVDGKDKSTISIKQDGTLHLTQANIINALGYTPGDASGKYELTLGDKESTEHSDSIVVNPFINLIGAGNTSIQVLGDGNVSVSGQEGKLSISLNSATVENLGGIKVNKVNSYTVEAQTSNISDNIASGKYYGVELDNNKKAFVHVPWIDYEVNKNSNGLAPKIITTNTEIISNNYYILATSGESASWYKLPSSAFSDTWRSIQINGTELLSNTESNPLNFVSGNKTSITKTGDNGIQIESSWRDIQINNKSIEDSTINFVPSGDIYIKADINEDDIVDLSFGLSWYNINKNSYEYDSGIYNS